jgi:hypothetical protein
MFIFLLLILLSSSTQAGQHLSISNEFNYETTANPEVASIPTFKELTSSLPYLNYSIVRSHINELSSQKVLASYHGYHLIKGQINCLNQHCNHLDVVPLSQFNAIKASDLKNSINKGNSLTSQAINQLDANLWLADIVSLSSWSRKSGSTGNENAKTWIVNKMNALTLDVSTQEYTVSGNTTQNIIGVQVGNSRADDWYIVGAHMDSRPYSGNAPGAVDNASGCAAVLETARVARMYNFEGTLIFICYSGEEQGLIGSTFHANSLINNGNQTKVKAALTMDMVGYTSNSAHELLLESSSSNQWLIDILAQNAATYAPNLTVFTSTNPFGSDHVPYINNGMHGILLIDDDWSIYPAYHQSNDLPENINLIQGEYILKTNFGALAQLAGLQPEADVIFANSFE